jgi:hypothetical protein
MYRQQTISPELALLAFVASGLALSAAIGAEKKEAPKLLLAKTTKVWAFRRWPILQIQSRKAA